MPLPSSQPTHSCSNFLYVTSARQPCSHSAACTDVTESSPPLFAPSAAMMGLPTVYTQCCPHKLFLALQYCLGMDVFDIHLTTGFVCFAPQGTPCKSRATPLLRSPAQLVPSQLTANSALHQVTICLPGLHDEDLYRRRHLQRYFQKSLPWL